MNVTRNEQQIIITLEIDNLMAGAEMMPDQWYKINDREKMADYFVNYFTEFGNGDGDSEFTKLIDKLFHEAYESGEEWLDIIDHE